MCLLLLLCVYSFSFLAQLWAAAASQGSGWLQRQFAAIEQDSNPAGTSGGRHTRRSRPLQRFSPPHPPSSAPLWEPHCEGPSRHTCSAVPTASRCQHWEESPAEAELWLGPWCGFPRSHQHITGAPPPLVMLLSGRWRSVGELVLRAPTSH